MLGLTFYDLFIACAFYCSKGWAINYCYMLDKFIIWWRKNALNKNPEIVDILVFYSISTLLGKYQDREEPSICFPKQMKLCNSFNGTTKSNWDLVAHYGLNFYWLSPSINRQRYFFIMFKCALFIYLFLF